MWAFMVRWELWMLNKHTLQNTLLTEISAVKRKYMGLTVQDIIRCNINSVRASFMAPEKKLKLIEELLSALEACAS